MLSFSQIPSPASVISVERYRQGDDIAGDACLQPPEMAVSTVPWSKEGPAPLLGTAVPRTTMAKGVVSFVAS